MSIRTPPRRTAHAARAALAVLAAALALPAAAAELPVPKVMADAPPDKGKWKMEMLEMDGRDMTRLAGRMGSEMTLCVTAAEAMSRRQQGRAERQKCESKLVEDSATRAVVEVACAGDPPEQLRSTITREAARQYAIATAGQRGDRPLRMKARMSYVGSCSAGDSAVTLGKDSAVCQQARAGMAADRAQCEAALAGAKARIDALCR